MLEEYASSKLREDGDRGRLDIVRLSLRLLWMLQRDEMKSETRRRESAIELVDGNDHRLSELWKKLWLCIAAALRTYQSDLQTNSPQTLTDSEHNLPRSAKPTTKTTHHSVFAAFANSIRWLAEFASLVPNRIGAGISSHAGSTAKGFAGTSDLACDCLDIIASLRKKNPDKPSFPDGFIVALHNFLTPDDKHWFFVTPSDPEQPGSFDTIEVEEYKVALNEHIPITSEQKHRTEEQQDKRDPSIEEISRSKDGHSEDLANISVLPYDAAPSWWNRLWRRSKSSSSSEKASPV